MEWYYATDQQAIGPVAETDFERMVKEGQITPKTLVWKQGMAGWQEFGKLGGKGNRVTTVPGNGGSIGGQLRCSECGTPFSRNDMIRFQGRWVCAGCKPVFVQKLKEGAALSGAVQYGGFWIRVVATFIDGLILGAVNIILSLVFFSSTGFMMVAQQNMMPSDGGRLAGLYAIYMVLVYGLQAAYMTWFVGKFGATPGKMACKLKIIRPDGSKVTYARAFGRYFGYLLSSIILCIGYIMAGFDQEKRALHDMICDTRVIRN
jgi:uncharacterized RDD family membrane protein YckC